MNNKNSNKDGINGLGTGIVNTNSSDFKFLQNKIIEKSKKQSPTQIVENQLLSLRFKLETYLKLNNHAKIICYTLPHKGRT